MGRDGSSPPSAQDRGASGLRPAGRRVHGPGGSSPPSAQDRGRERPSRPSRRDRGGPTARIEARAAFARPAAHPWPGAIEPAQWFKSNTWYPSFNIAKGRIPALRRFRCNGKNAQIAAVPECSGEPPLRLKRSTSRWGIPRSALRSGACGARAPRETPANIRAAGAEGIQTSDLRSVGAHALDGAATSEPASTQAFGRNAQIAVMSDGRRTGQMDCIVHLILLPISSRLLSAARSSSELACVPRCWKTISPPRVEQREDGGVVEAAPAIGAIGD